MIEVVTLENLKDLQFNPELANLFFKEAGLPGTFKFEAFLHNWTMLLEKNMGVMWKLTRDNKLIGMLGGILVPDLNDGELTATEAFWYVLPEARMGIGGVHLLLTFEKWAKEVGAKRIIMAHLMMHNSESLANFYSNKGYKPSEIFYVKVL